MRRYSTRDTNPRWIEARFASTGRCGHSIRKGERIYYYPSAKSAYCAKCGDARAAEVAADDFDQMVYDSWRA